MFQSSPLLLIGSFLSQPAFSHIDSCFGSGLSTARMAAQHPTLHSFGNVLGGSDLLAPCEKAFRNWHTCVHKMMNSVGESEGYDSATQAMFDQFVQDHVHDSVTFAPPTYFATYTGKGPFSVILSCVARVFGKTFTYHRQWLSDDGREWALEFTADGLGGSDKSIRGIDLVSLDAEGRIVSFRILAGSTTS